MAPSMLMAEAGDTIRREREGEGGKVDDEDGGFERWWLWGQRRVRWRLKVVAMGVEEEDDGSKARWSSTIGCGDGMECGDGRMKKMVLAGGVEVGGSVVVDEGAEGGG
ncbi:hypothetical protein PIB30_074974 [Stylosanthes scabra]|uniref:Uncharacterized protein n=1 Tax=Stylosanthes scabra TaxID=79078 RepID=A0ABU6VRN6_9FABA|nr:hypothetical protein [Stylosanthes scabra]